MNNPKISVIIPLYNVEEYLSECLDSIVNQTLKDIEIICINDGSTDNSLSILKDYASKDNRIKIIDKENEGQGYARKIGLDIATGKYILFCDSDDYYAELTTFEELYNYIEKVKVDVVIFEFIRFCKNIERYDVNGDLFNAPQKEIFSYIDINNILFFRAYAWRKIYSKKFLDSYNDWYFPKHIMYEDIPFHFQIITRARMSYVNKQMYIYRMRENSATHIMNDKIICDHCVSFLKSYEVLKEKFDNLDFCYFMWHDFFEWALINYQIKSIDTAQQIIDLIKYVDTSDLFDLSNVNKEAFLFFRTGLQMNPEDFMEYLNQKVLKNREINKLKLDKKTQDNQIKKIHEQLQQNNKAITMRDSIIKNKDSAINQKNNEIQNLCTQNKNLCIQNKNLITQNNIQEQVIKHLENSWSYKIGRLFTYPLSIPLVFYRFIRDYNLIKKSDLFDTEYYLANNKDVKNAKVDPIKHYLQFGWKEGRNPSAEFNGNEYLNKRPDVQVAGICPLVHFIKFGKNEDLSFFFEKVKNLEIKNTNLENKNKKFEQDNKNLEKKLNEKSVEFEQLNRKKSEVDIKLVESTKEFEKLHKRIADLENFKKNILIVYKQGINKDKISFEIEKFLEFSKLGITTEKREPELIVSLTSYPARIHEVYYTIFSIFTQTLKPNKIILWLGEDKFPNRDRDLPKNLLEFTKYGLTIKYTKDLKSHTKLIPTLKEYPKSIIVTVDDDIFYPSDWLEKLYDCWQNNNDCIICHRIAIPEITKDKELVPFNNWKEYEDIMESSLINFAVGLDGVLYPPNSFYKDILNEEIFMKLAPNADDIWFWAMEVLNGTKRKKVDNYKLNKLWINPARERNITDEPCLWKINCVNSNNQNQIQLDNIINHYPQIMEKLLNEKLL